MAIGALRRVLAVAQDDDFRRSELRRRRLLGPEKRTIEVPSSQASNLGNFLVKPFAPKHFVDAALGANVGGHAAELASKLSGLAQHSG